MKPTGHLAKVMFILIALIFMLFSSFTAGWYDPAGSCRRPILIDTSLNGDTLCDFQVKMDIPYDAAMQPDFDDIRVRKYAHSEPGCEIGEEQTPVEMEEDVSKKTTA
jgi:hypothetical protein